jgi:hypothetical protein
VAKTYLATKQEVQDVEQSITVLNTQINTATTGIGDRVTELETNNTELAQLRVDVDTVDSQINDPITGLVKAVTDIDTQINEADTGVIARLDDLEQGSPVSSGYFQQESVTSDDWVSICEVGGLSIEARNPGFTSSFPIRLVNQTGATLVHITDKLYDNGTRADGAFTSNNGASLGISPPALTSDAQDRLLGSSYVSGNGFGRSEKAWSYSIVVRRIGTTGYRIVASLVGN